MYTGSLPSTSIYGTWVENIEILSADDDTPWDTSALIEVTVELIDPVSMFVEMSLKKSVGQVTLPAPGVIQWRAEASQMATLAPMLYELLIILRDSSDTVPLVIGTISIID